MVCLCSLSHGCALTSCGGWCEGHRDSSGTGPTVHPRRPTARTSSPLLGPRCQVCWVRGGSVFFGAPGYRPGRGPVPEARSLCSRGRLPPRCLSLVTRGQACGKARECVGGGARSRSFVASRKGQGLWVLGIVSPQSP